MSERFTVDEKAYISKYIETACGGTPLQPNAEFAGGYLGNLVVQLMENWDETKKNIHTEGAKTTVVHSDVKRRRIIKP